MFRLWGKEFHNNHLLKDLVICNDDPSLNRTRKIFQGLEEICFAFDLIVPIWLDSTAIPNAVLPRTVLLNRLILIFWRFR